MPITRPICRFALLALICCAGLATTASVAAARPTHTRATHPVAHAASTSCLWKNAYADPKLYIRTYPSRTASVEPYTISLGGHFYGSDRGHFNDGVYWVQLDAGGWANASYLQWIKGGTWPESSCMD